MLKKIVLFAMVLSFTLIFANEKEVDYFQDYRKNPTFENFQKAITYYNSNLKKDSKDYESNLYLSYLYFMEMDKNVKTMQANFDSLDTRTKFSLANLLLSLGKYEESLKYYDILNKDVPKWSCPWRHKGEALLKLKRYNEAEEALKKAIETRKEHYDAYIMLAEVQNKLGKYKVALQTLETGLSYKGKDIEDSEDEVSDLDVQFLKLELFKKNNKMKEFKNLEKLLKEKAPKDERWNRINS